MKSTLGRKLAEDQEAQSVFHRVLLPDLVEHGASSRSAILDRGLKLFKLPLEDPEIEDVLELARRKRLVEPLSDAKDAYGDAIEEVEWAATPPGRELRRKQGLTVGAFRNYVIEVSPAGPKVATAVQGVLGLLITVPVLQPLFSKPDAAKEGSSQFETGALAIGIVLALFLGLMLYRGMSSEGQLRRAAIAWDRLRARWPRFWSWQVNVWRPRLCLLGVVLFVAPGVIRLIDGDGHVWLLIPYLSGAALLFALWAVHQQRISTRIAPASDSRTATPVPADPSA